MWLTAACKIAQYRKKVILFRNKIAKNTAECSVLCRENGKGAPHSRKNAQTAGGVSDTSDGLKQRQRDKGRKFFIRKIWWVGVAPVKKFLARCPGEKQGHARAGASRRMASSTAADSGRQAVRPHRGMP